MAELLNINKNNGKQIKAIYIVPKKGTDVTGLFSKYLLPLDKENREAILFIAVDTPDKGVLKKDIAYENIEFVYEVADTYGVDTLIVTNADYYKFLINAKKKPAFERDIGSIKKVGDYNIIPNLNYIVVNYQPNKAQLLQLGNSLINTYLNGEYVNKVEELQKEMTIINTDNVKQVEKYFERLKTYEVVACDIEATGLNWYKDELLTISFAMDELKAFCIPLHKTYSENYKEMLKLTKKFFEEYQGKIVFHNASFDIPFLVRVLFMGNLQDHKGKVYGINQFDVEDTMIMASLCLNNVDKPKLGLKHLAYSRYGDWDAGIDVVNLINTSFEEVSKYNNIDSMATLYLYNKYKSRLIEEEQDELYNNFYKRFLKGLMKLKMTGLTVNRDGFKELELFLNREYNRIVEEMQQLSCVSEAKDLIVKAELEKRNAKLKTKVLTKDDINIEFNPRSSNHIKVLLFDVLGLPIINKTKTKAPATDKKTLKTLLGECKEGDEDYIVLKLLLELAEIKNVKSTFVEKLSARFIDVGNDTKLFGNFNITGTVSGRLSSSEPNLQNLPSGSKYGEAIKKLLIADKGYIIAQADYAALEDRVGANITQDPNKLRVFTEHIDGHSLAASYYFQDELEARGIFIDRNDPKSINSIKEVAPDLRQKGKAVTSI